MRCCTNFRAANGAARCVRRRRGDRIRRPGFSMAEVIISLGLVGGLLVVSLNTVSGASLGRRLVGERGAARMLAAALMNEILQQNYADPESPGNVIGVEAGEIGGGTRLLFDDVDDYHNWTESPPMLRHGSLLADRVTWSRSVIVEYVQPGDLTLVSATNQGLKRITVTVTRQNDVLARLTAVRFGTVKPGTVFDLNIRLPVLFD